jgi:hypothetical protein
MFELEIRQTTVALEALIRWEAAMAEIEQKKRAREAQSSSST